MDRQTTAPCTEDALEHVERLLLTLADDRFQSGKVRWALECRALRVQLGWLH